MQLTDALTMKRAVPAVMTVAVHLLVAYVLAISVGAAPKVAPMPDITVIDLPKPQEPVANEPTPTAASLDLLRRPPVLNKPDIPVEQPTAPSQDAPSVVNQATDTIASAPMASVDGVRLLKQIEPEYPRLARLQGEEGIVYVHITIMPTGEIGAVHIERSSGSARLDAAALQAVRNWRFAPARHGAEPITASVVVPVRFELH